MKTILFLLISFTLSAQDYSVDTLNEEEIYHLPIQNGMSVYYDNDIITIECCDMYYIVHSEVSEYPIFISADWEDINSLLYWIHEYPLEEEDQDYSQFYYNELIKEKFYN